VTPAQADRAVAVIEAALLDAGALTRAALEERLAACDIPTAGQALPHLLLAAALRGVALLGPVDGAGQRFVLARDWLGSEPPTRLEGDERERSLAELARRYLGGHGPATPADLGSWSGLPLRDARAGLEAIAGELVHLGDDLVDLAGDDPAAGRVPPRLLGAFDPLLLGHRDRDLIVPARHARRVHPGGGVVRAVATDDARAFGTWTARRRDERLAVEIDGFAPLGARVAGALRAEAADVARFRSLALA
jgi:hypothetical protein